MSFLSRLFNPFLFASLSWLARSRRPKTTGSLQVHGLGKEAGIYRDRWGVPHIYTSSLNDLLFAQGFVHAQDRLWQMDMQRRLVAGRLSEITGEQTIQIDRWMRALSMRRVAEQEVGLLEDEVLAGLQAYCSGVNAAIENGPRPVEYVLLGCYPELWSVPDILSWVKMMSWSLSVNWEAEIVRARLIDKLGPELASELEPDFSEQGPIIVPEGADYRQVGDSALERAEEARLATGPSPQSGIGSNNWAISGERTTTGRPLYANDMHLMLSIPSVWYENHLTSDDLQVTGITFPGIPGVVSGHNGHVAWGYTNGFADVQDLYMERLRRTPDGRVEYEYREEWLEAEVFHEEIQVKNKPAVQAEVIATHHGPIINELSPELTGEQPLALRWTSLEKDGMLNSLFQMLKSRNCYEFREALRGWTAPVQNVVFSDSEGNIAHVLAGKVPVRAKGDGRVPVPGWTGEYEWQGYIPFDELPQCFNPPQGYIVTANNRVVDDSYPHFISRDFITGDRAQRITDLLESQEKVDIPTIQRMHFDLVSPSARTVAQYIGELKVDDPELSAVVDRMRTWDGELAAGSPAAAVYQVFLRRIISLTLKDKLGELSKYYMGLGITPQLADTSLLGFRSYEWLIKVMGEPGSHWFDQGGGEGRDDLMRQALQDTVDYLKAEQGPKMDDWAWGKIHQLTFKHSLGLPGPLARLFNRGPYPIGGDFNTVWASGARLHNLDSEGITGPPFRFIADLCDLSRSVGLLTPGQSGTPGSQHYDDQIDAFFEGMYHPMLWKKRDVGRQTEEVLWLIP